MSTNRETNLALFIDFDNVALGARDARQRFEVKLLMQRILEKGKIIVKRAYADWHFYKEHMSSLHEAAIELIEIPMPKISGKNSADIKLVVDAMDLCHSKDHIDTFVIVSGDSDFSPLVSKLRENNKRVIGIGMKNSSSKLLIGNCDEFIFYDDIFRQARGQAAKTSVNVPLEKRDLFDFLVATAQSLLQESRGVLYSSLIKDTMTRKKPDFNERAYGYSTFGDLLEEARNLGLLVVERDARAGGTWVVQGIGPGVAAESKGTPAETPAAPLAERPPSRSGSSRSSRRRRRPGDRPGRATHEGAEASAPDKRAQSADARPDDGRTPATGVAGDSPATGGGKTAQGEQQQVRSSAAGESESQRKSAPKTQTKKSAAKKPAVKKTEAKKTEAKTGTKKTTTKKAAPKKTAPKKATPNAPAKKTPAKKSTPKKVNPKETPDI